MSFAGNIAPPRRTKTPRAAARAARGRSFGVLMLGAALAGCSAGGGAGAFLVDPGRYSAYHCNDLAARAKVLAAREKDLHALMERADQGGGGGVIGSLAYRPDYDSVLGEEKLLQRTAAEKNCTPVQQFQSDQVIR